MARVVLKTLGPNWCCWMGAATGILAMVAFDWIHIFDRFHPPAGWNELFNPPYWLSNESTGFGKLLTQGTPGTFLFLVGTIFAVLTSLGGIAQASGMALFLVDASKHFGVVYPATLSHFQLGFYFAVASTLITLMGWGLRSSHGTVRMNTSRIAALSPRLGLFAR